MQTIRKIMGRAALTAMGLALLGATASKASAVTSSVTISDVQLGPSLYQYNLTLADDPSSTTPIGTLWYAWIPGQDYLTTSPTSITEPTGWSLSAVTHGGASDGYGIRWQASTTGNAIQPGGSLSGFSFQSSDPPSIIFGNSTFYPSTPTSTFFTYSGITAFSGTSVSGVGTAAIPEPASLAIIAPVAMLLGRRRRATAG